jgi:IS5 family transposase
MRPGKRKALLDADCGRLDEQIEKTKSSIRAKVEHQFHYVKNLFGHKKARYWRLGKNTAQLFTLFAMANLVIAKRRLFALNAQSAC